MKSRTALEPLGTAQRQLVEDYVYFAYKIAHEVWRRLGRPVADLEEMQGEALLELCVCAGLYLSGKMTFSSFAGFLIRKRLYRVFYRQHQPLPTLGDGDLEILARPHLGQSLEDQQEQIAQMLECLTERQREIIEKRFGLNGNPPLGQTTLSKILSIRESAVWKTERRALSVLRSTFGNQAS